MHKDLFPRKGETVTYGSYREVTPPPFIRALNNQERTERYAEFDRLNPDAIGVRAVAIKKNS